MANLTEFGVIERRIEIPPLPDILQEAHGKDMVEKIKPVNCRYCLVGVKLAHKSLLGFGGLSAQNAELGIRLNMQSLLPFVELRIKAVLGTDKEYTHRLHFDPDFLDLVELKRFDKSDELWGDLEAVAAKAKRLQTLDRSKTLWRVKMEMKEDNLAKRNAWSLQSVSKGPVAELPKPLTQAFGAFCFNGGVMTVFYEETYPHMKDNSEYFSMMLGWRASLVPPDFPPSKAWWFARQELFNTDMRSGGGYAPFAREPKELAIPTWWRVPNTNDYAPFISENRKQNDPWFMNGSHCETVLAPGLIWEAAARRAMSDQLFGKGAPNFICKLEPGCEENTWRVLVPISIDTASNDDLVLPKDGTAVEIQVCNKPGRNWKPWRGHMYQNMDSSTAAQYPQVVILRNPRNKAGKETDLGEGEWEISILLDDCDLALRAELNALATLCGPEKPGVGKFENVFNLHEVMFSRMGDSPKRKSPNWWDKMKERFPENECKRRRAFMNSQLVRFGAEPKKILMNAVTGVRGCVMVASGCPGAGKTTLLASMAVCHLLCGVKVLIVSHTSGAVDQVIIRILELTSAMKDQELAELIRSQIIRVYAPSIEERLESSVLGGAGVLSLETEEQTVAEVNSRLLQYTLTKRLEKYCNEHPKESAAIHFLEHRRARVLNEELVESVYSHYYEDRTKTPQEAYREIETALFMESFIVAATNHTARDFYGRGYHADVVIVDEASTIADATACVLLSDQYMTNLVVLCGDLKQLPPRVASRDTQNPMRALLDDSVMRRWIAANRSIPVIELIQDLRRVKELFDFTNVLFYDNKLTLGTHSAIHKEKRVSSAMRSAFTRSNFFKGLLRDHSQRNLFCVDVQTREQRDPGSGSVYNPGGIEAVVNLAKDILGLDGIRGDDLIIMSFYKAAVKRIQQKMETDGKLPQGLVVKTVDSLQGSDALISIIHEVRAKSSAHPFGFTALGGRQNTATSRAALYQFMVGNFTLWKQNLQHSSADVRQTYPVMRDMLKYIQQKVPMVTYPKT